MRPFPFSFFAVPLCVAASAALGAGALSGRAAEQRFNLADEKPPARFRITDITWPAQEGDAEICLWHDDRLAALSITIDDNSAPDIPWWREKAAAHGFRATWFVITGRISGPNAFNGTWAEYQSLLDEGHGVESHSVGHLHMDKGPGPGGSGWSIDWEYAESLRQLHTHLTGPRASALAYPGGANKTHNNRELAARLFRAARGGSGMPNAANRTDYLNINGMSGFHFGEAAQAWADLRNLIDRTIYGDRAYRGWAVVLAHLVTDKARPSWERLFEFIDANRDKLWVGLFTDIAKYGQQRDTARLSVEENAPGRIRFSITDGMDDAYFDHPLTVKIRVPDAWASVSATQAGEPVAARREVRGSAVYALVQAVPDRGPVVCTP